MRLLQFMITLSVWAVAQQAVIEFKHKVQVNPGKILLGSLAKIHGDSNLVERLNQLEVGRIDKPGRSTRVSIQAVKSFYLRSICPLEQLAVIGDGSVHVESRAHVIGRDSILQLLIEAVGPKMTGIQGKDWQVDGSRLPLSIPAPLDHAELRIELQGRFDGKGQETAILRVLQNGNSVGRHSLSFTMRRWGFAVKANRPIQRGQMVLPGHIALERIELTGNRRNLVTTLEDVTGRTALRTISRDSHIAEDWLERPYAIKDGEPVKLMVQVGSGRVSVSAVARQNGYAGQVIEVENGATRQIVQARIDKAGEVWIVN